MSELKGKTLPDASEQALLAECAPLSPAELHAYLNADAPLPVTIALNRNRVSMISVDFSRRKSVRVRMHHAFAAAPRPVLAALRRYLRNQGQEDWRLVAVYARGIRVEPPHGAAPVGSGRGEVHDLDALGASVNGLFFAGRVKCRIGWGRSAKRRGRRGGSRSMRFGSWQEATRTIRIHPRLDDPRVPEAFVRYIVFHEMLHAAISDARSPGSRGAHDAFFRRQERKYPGWAEMQRLSMHLLDVLR